MAAAGYEARMFRRRPTDSFPLSRRVDPPRLRTSRSASRHDRIVDSDLASRAKLATRREFMESQALIRHAAGPHHTAWHFVHDH